MEISSIGTGGLSASPPARQGGGDDARLRSLEQRLQQLSAEREKAVQRGDRKAKEKLERQIRALEKQIQQLRQRQERRADAPARRPGADPPPAEGRYIDVYA